MHKKPLTRQYFLLFFKRKCLDVIRGVQPLRDFLFLVGTVFVVTGLLGHRIDLLETSIFFAIAAEAYAVDNDSGSKE